MNSAIFKRDAQDEERRAQRRRKKALYREALGYAELISNGLARLGFDHVLRKESRPSMFQALFTGKRARQVIQFRMARANENTIWLLTDTRKLPYRVRAVDLLDPDVGRELSLICRKQVDTEFSVRSGGIWIRIDREGSTAGVPNKLGFRQAFNQIPQAAPPLTMMIGATNGRQILRADLADMPHFLVAGESGGGKSVMLNQALLTLMYRNSPDDLQVWLIDLKAGVEFIWFQDAPHIKETAYVSDELDQLLDNLYKEVHRRFKLIRGVALNLDGWNYQHKDEPAKRLPFIVLAVDELGELMGLKRHRDKLQSILQLGRAAGVHCILSTQTPTREIIQPEIRHNIPSRMAFSCSQPQQSIIIIGNAQATNLTPRGRAVINYKGEYIEIQAPFVDQKTIEAGVNQIRKRWDVTEPTQQEKEDTQLLNDILTYALENLGGSLAQRPLWEPFRDRIAWMVFTEKLKELEGEVIPIDGQLYEVIPSDGGAKPRRLSLVELEEETPGDNATNYMIQMEAAK